MRSFRLPILAWALGFLAIAGCNPDRVLLQFEIDAAPAPEPPPPTCLESDECGPSAACIDSACTPCDVILQSCNCPPETTASKYLVGECTACHCLPACRFHSECPADSFCAAGGCRKCAEAPPCPASCNWKWKPVRLERNGCAVCECAPPNECVRDEDCPDGLVCYAGRQCADGCVEPGCCHGNLCSLPGCDPPQSADCAYVGCKDGVCSGDPSCALTGCKCAPGATDEWSCPNTCFTACQTN